jgi:hypothetical protein
VSGRARTRRFARPLGRGGAAFDVRGAGCSVADSCRCWYLCAAGPPAVPGGGGWRQPGRCLSSCCRLAGTLAGRAGSCLAGGAGRVLAWRVNGTTGQALRHAGPAERQLPSAQPGSWCVLPHRGGNRSRAWCFLAVSDRQSAGWRGSVRFMAMACRRSSRRRSGSSALDVRARPCGDVPAIPPPAVSSRPETRDPGLGNRIHPTSCFHRNLL